MNTAQKHLAYVEQALREKEERETAERTQRAKDIENALDIVFAKIVDATKKCLLSSFHVRFVLATAVDETTGLGCQNIFAPSAEERDADVQKCIVAAYAPRRAVYGMYGTVYVWHKWRHLLLPLIDKARSEGYDAHRFMEDGMFWKCNSVSDS